MGSFLSPLSRTELSRIVMGTIILVYYITITVHFPITCSARYLPIFNGFMFTLHRARVLNNVVITTIIEMVEMVKLLNGRVQLSE